MLSKEVDIRLRVYFIFLCIYPLSGLSGPEKENFLFNLLGSILLVPSEEMLLLYGDIKSSQALLQQI